MPDPKPPPPFEALLNTGRQAYATGQPDAAIAALDKAMTLATSSEQLRLLSTIHRRFGRMEQTVAALRAVLQHEPEAGDVYLNIALSLTRQSEDAEVQAMLGLHDRLPPAQRHLLGFALGKTYEDLGQFDRALAYYTAANAERRAELRYSPADTEADFDRIRATFTPDLFARFAGSGITGMRPIFIVGMPRSGSTLTEQILASHPDVLGGGEMNLLLQVESTMLHNSGMDSLGAFLDITLPAELRDWARAYLQPVRQALGGKTRFTDKNLDNFRRIGLIRLLFPDAKIVHCTRDPLDTCFSIYRHVFAGTNVPYGYDQTELGGYYRLYRQLMAHWSEVLPGFVLDHSYEAVIADPEPTLRRLLAFCQLGWDPRVLDFHKTERGVVTASAAQVRRPLYADSVGLASAYRSELAPLIAALGDALQAPPSGVSTPQ